MNDPCSFALDRAIRYREFRDPPLPESLRGSALACFSAERRAAAGRVFPAATPISIEAGAASDAALERILESGRTIGGIVADRDVANAVPFNARLASDVVWDREVGRCRRRLDSAMDAFVRSFFTNETPVVLIPAGLWWYPPGTSFGWHTNHSFPGWRLYLSHAKAAGRSCFRYRDPETGVTVTSWDGSWDLRLFEVTAERPFWHAVASETDRFSVGWVVRSRSLAALVRRSIGRLLPRRF